MLIYRLYLCNHVIVLTGFEHHHFFCEVINRRSSKEVEVAFLRRAIERQYYATTTDNYCFHIHLSMARQGNCGEKYEKVIEKETFLLSKNIGDFFTQ